MPPRSAWRPRERTSSKEAQRLLPRPLLVIITIVLCVIVVVPALYVVLASVNSDLGVASGEYWPSSFSLKSYSLIWSTANLATGLVNSVIVASVVAVASAILGTITAYVLVRYTFVGRITILRGLVGLQSIPGTLMLLPVFVLYASAGNYLGIQVIGTRWGLMIAYLTFALPFSTWVMVTYLRGLPRELEEAARVDGASILTILFRIIMPLSLPAIVVSGIFAFLLGLERRPLRLGADPARHADRRGGVADVRGDPGERGAAGVLADHGGLGGLRRARRPPLRGLPALPDRRPDRRRGEVTR